MADQNPPPPAKTLADKIEKLDDRASDTLKNVFQLLNMYTVFQGVIIAAVSQLSSSSSSKCYQWKYFLTFSVAMFVVYGVSLAYMAHKFVQVRKKRDRCILERAKAKAGQSARPEKLKPDGWLESRYYSVATVTIVCLLAFNVFVAYASHAMLCGNNKHVVSANANCLQVCDKICTAGN